MNTVDRLSRNTNRIVERADIQVPPAPIFPPGAVTGPTTTRLAAVASFNESLKRWRNDRWTVDAPFVTEDQLNARVTVVFDDATKLTARVLVAETDLSDLEARVTALETSVTTIQTDITNIDARVTILEGEIGTAVPHTILDAVVHTDSVTQTVSRGSFVYGNTTPKWDEFVIGPNATFIRSNGTDPSWSSVSLSTDITGTLPVANGGTGAVTLTGMVQGNGVAAMTAITGTANYFPKWSATAPYLTPTSMLYDDGSKVGVATATPTARFTVKASLNLDENSTTFHVGDGTYGFWIGNGSNGGFVPIFRTLGFDSNDRFINWVEATAANDGVGNASAMMVVTGSRTPSASIQNRPIFDVSNNFGAAMFRVAALGNVAIGNINPLDKLHVTASDAVTIATTTLARLEHTSTGTPGISFGAQLVWSLKSSTTANQDAGAINVAWADATHATRTSVMFFRNVSNGSALTTTMALSGAGGLSVGDAIASMPNGVVNVVTGFRVNLSALTGSLLKGNGTNFVPLTIGSAAQVLTVVGADAVWATPAPGVTFANPSALIGMTMIPGVATTAMRSDAAPAIDPNIAPVWTNGHTFNMGTTPTLSAISIDIDATGAPGTRDSHAIAWIGRSNAAGVPHTPAWRAWVDVTTDAGASFFNIENNLDAGAYSSRLRIYSTGLVEIGPNGIGVTQLDTYGLGLVNTTPAVAGDPAGQQWSGPLRFEGRGWETAVGTSMKTEFRQYIVPVQGSAAPTVYWLLEHSVNDAAYTEILRANSTGFVRLLKDAIANPAQNTNSALGLQITNTTLAIAGTQQQSPALILTGSGYHTTTGPGPETLSFRQQVVPVEGTSATGGYWRIDSKVGGGSYTSAGTLMLNDVGGMSLGAIHLASAIPFGVFSTQVGYRIAGSAPTVGHVLRSNGTHFIDGVIGPTDVSGLFANPTASIGLAVVNGVATTAMRSDAAPALSQAIAPTWTANHIWQQSVNGTATLIRQDNIDTTAASSAQAISMGFRFARTGDATARPAAEIKVLKTQEWTSVNTTNTAKMELRVLTDTVNMAAGVVIVGNSAVANTDVYLCNPTLSPSDNFGFVFVPRSAGTPSGVPAADGAFLINDADRAVAYYAGAWYQHSRRTLASSTTQTGNTALTETDLFTNSIAAGTGTINGATIDFVTSGTFATSISTDKRIRVYWATILIFDSGALAITSTSDWVIYGTVIRVDATNFKAAVSLATSSGTLSAYADYTTGASTWANANTLKVTGSGTNASDVVGELHKICYEM